MSKSGARRRGTSAPSWNGSPCRAREPASAGQLAGWCRAKEDARPPRGWSCWEVLPPKGAAFRLRCHVLSHRKGRLWIVVRWMSILSNGEHALTQPLPPSRKCGKGHRCGEPSGENLGKGLGKRLGKEDVRPPGLFPLSAGRLMAGSHPPPDGRSTRTRFQAWAEAAVSRPGSKRPLDRAGCRYVCGQSAAIAPARSARKEWRDPGAIGRSWDDALRGLVAVHERARSPVREP